MYFLIITVTYWGGSRRRVSGSKQIQKLADNRRGPGNFQSIADVPLSRVPKR